MEWTVSRIAILVVFGLIGLWFLLRGWRDVGMLVTRPTKGLGMGFSRVWAVARTTLIEAWVTRIWLAPILWLIISIILLATVRGYNDTELIPLYVQVLLWAQQIIVMVMLWVMACMSLPRERERKIVITNASKPLSRLEMLLGKMTGFSVAAFFLYLLMGLVTWGMLKFEDGRIRANAALQAQLAKNDFSVKDNAGVVARPEVLKRIADEGTLFAYNYLTVAKGGMSIVGKAETTPKGIVRYIKGGSYENTTYTFSPRIFGKAGALVGAYGQKPFFYFRYPVSPYFPNQPLPKTVQISVTAMRVRDPLHPQSKTVNLYQQAGGYVGSWEPDSPDQIFTATNDYASYQNEDDRGEVTLTMTCPTQGVLLQLYEGADPDPVTHVMPDGAQFNVFAVGDREASSNIMPPKSHPTVTGFVRHDVQEIAGPDRREVDYFGPNIPREVAVFRFPAEELHEVPVTNGQFTLALNLDTDRSANQLVDTVVQLQVYNEEEPANMQTLEMPVMEKRVTPVLLPESFLGDNDVRKRGDLIVFMQCKTMGHAISVPDDAVRLEQPQSFFIVTLLKSEAVLFLETVLLVVVSVTCSVRLGWPVALLLSAGCYILGYCSDLLAHAVENGGLTAINYVSYSNNQPLGYRILDKSFEGLWISLQALSSIMPNMSRYDYLEYIVQLRNMPTATLGFYTLLTLFFIFPFLAVGYLLMRKQELG